MSRSLQGRRALVTGGGRNIGRAIALAFAEAGADVAVIGRTDQVALDEVANAVREAGGRSWTGLADVADPDAVEHAVDAVAKAFGGLDIVVNNAALRRHLPFAEIDYAEWRAILGPILDGAFLVSRAALPHLRASGRGRLITMGGLSAHKGAPERAHVIAAKTGVIGLTRALAMELGADGITANCIVPGRIDTERAPGSPEPEMGPGGPPVGRLGTPSDVATAALWLAGDGGAYVTGQAIHVNGGLFLG